MPSLAELKTFDVHKAAVSLWLFKSSAQKLQPPTFSGRWISTSTALETAVKSTALAQLTRIKEILQYGLLAQNNENSALTIATLETHADLIVNQCAAELSTRKVKNVKEVNNTKFYVLKFAIDKKVLLAVRRTDSSWQTHRLKDTISALFQDAILTLDESPRFSISRHIDFFIFGNKVFVTNKSNFESVLSYKLAHKAEFDALTEELEFKSVFASIDALLNYVGDNKIQLRRACVIRQKGFYRDANFLTNLRNDGAKYGLKIDFDADGKIVPNLDNCRDIFQALLDHRLASAFSQKVYDVQDTAVVNV